MGYLIQLTDYNSEIALGPNEGEAISQSLVFGKSFQLNSIIVRLGTVTIDPVIDLKIRCEVREAVSSESLLNFDDSPIMTSDWKTDNSLISNAYNAFELSRTILDSGTYYFSFVSDVRARFPIYFSLKNTGTFRGKFIKTESGTGTYRSTYSLAVKIDGVWQVPPAPTTITEMNTYTQTTIRDES
jgi:hypothetical protein